MNELAHLKRVSSVKTNAGVKFLTPSAFPGNHCPLHTALALCSRIRGMSTLVVGTAECGTYSRNVVARGKNEDGELHWIYVLDANEVVFGCRKGVMEAIGNMSEAGAKTIMLILTCVPEVIGEDIEGIVHEAQPQVSARLSAVKMGHFKCNSHPSGYWKTLAAFADLMEPRDTRPDVINILGRSPDEEHIPMPHLLTVLEEKGYTLRMLAPNAAIEDFMAAPDACLSLVLSPYMNPLAQELEKRFGVAYCSLHETYGAEQIDALYDDIARRLGIGWDGAFDELRAKAQAMEARAMETLAGTRYIATHRSALPPLPLAAYLADFQMEPVLLHMEEYYPDDRHWSRVLVEKGQNPPLCHMVNDRADAVVLEALAPDLSLGEIPAGSGKIPCVQHSYEFYGQAGYERTAGLLGRMMAALAAGAKGDTRREQNGTV